MAKLRCISAKDCIKILCNDFGFHIARQKGSHIILKKISEGRLIGTVVPNHKELKIGTLKSIISLAEIKEDDFVKFI